MKVDNIKFMKDGWFVGDFEPSAFKTSEFEICYKFHHKGEKWDTHFHKKATEVNLLLEGRMVIQDTLLEAGDIFTLYPFEIADPDFLEDCTLIVIKTPSIPGDKYVFNIKK